MKFGINLMGGGFGVQADGSVVDFPIPDHAEIDYFAAKGFTEIRLGLSWERLQPQLNGALDATYLAQFRDLVDYARSKGMTAIIDLHNYGMYRDKLIGTAEVPVSAFADVWSKLATAFDDRSNAIFGLMNEPQQATAAQWLVAVNAGIAAIRAAGADQRILVSGAYWDGAFSWTTSDNASVIGKAGAVRDPLNNFAFEVHQYMDDTSGQHEWVVSETIGVVRLTAITEWARANHAKLYLGEFGVAENATALKALANMMDYLVANQDVWEGAAYWAAGKIPAGGYIYSVEPILGLIDTPQMDVLEDYTTARSVRTALADGTFRVDYYVTGRAGVAYSDVVDAGDHFVARTQFRADGTADKKVVLAADGSATVTTYGAAGVAHVDAIRVYDSHQQKLVETVWAADGTSIKSEFPAGSGSASYQEFRDATGVLTRTIRHGDDGHDYATYAAGKLVTNEHFTAGWVFAERTTHNANGTIVGRQLQQADGHNVIEQYSATSGIITSRAEYDAQWRSVSWTSFTATGLIQYVSKALADGTTQIIRAPTSLTLDHASVLENASASTLVGKVAGSDGNGGVMTYSLLDNAGGLFTVNPSTGDIRTTAVLDYETRASYSLTVRVTGVGGLVLDKGVTIGVTDVAEAPTGLSLDRTSIAENLAAGTLVGTARAVDPDGGALSYALVNAGSAPFAIDARTGAITSTAVLDYEAVKSYALTVRATDANGLTVDRAVTIGVTDVAEAPIGLSLDRTSIAENLAAGTLIGTARAVDPDGGALTYALVNTGTAPFAIDARTGMLTTTASLDYEARNSYAITLRATDTSGLAVDSAVKIGVIDVVETPAATRPVLPAGFAGFTDVRQLAESIDGPGSFRPLGHADAIESENGLTYVLPFHANGLIVLGSDYFDPHQI